MYLCTGFKIEHHGPGRFPVKKQTMEKTIAKIEWVVGWSTKQANTHVRRTTNYFGEFQYNDAYSKYILVSNRHNVIYCYLNKRIEYTDGSVKIVRKYHL